MMTPPPDPVELLQRLIRFQTVNPPGDEAECLAYLKGLLEEHGLAVTMLARQAERPNLIARLPGRGEAPPLLLQGHVDVVPVAGQQWTHPPFGGEIHDGCVWGRGALDMKGGVAMLVTALLRLKAAGTVPAGDIILCLLSDEEVGGEYGARWLVDNHGEQFAGVRYGIGEFGGFSMPINGQRFYPIQVAEKVGCQLRLTLNGPAGHGAIPFRGGTMAQLSRILARLEKKRTPIHITPVTRMMITAVAQATSPPTSLVMRGLLQPRLTDILLQRLPNQLAVMEPLLRNVVNATVVETDPKINVIPCEVVLKLDGRMLPGFTPAQMIAEVRTLIGEEVTIEQLDQGVVQRAEPDMGLFPLLHDILAELDPEGHPIPYMMPAVTDGRWFSKLGIQHYGFLPLKVPADFSFTALAHAADERVPISALNFGTDALTMLLERYAG